MTALDKLRELVARAMGDKPADEASIAQAERAIALLEDELATARATSQASRMAWEDLAARQAFEPPATDQAVVQAARKAAADVLGVEAVEAALEGAKRVLDGARRRADRAALEQWAESVRAYVARRAERYRRAEALADELAEIVRAEESEGAAARAGLPGDIRERAPRALFGGSGLTRAILRRTTAASAGAFSGVPMMPREFGTIASEAFDEQAQGAGYLLADVARELGEPGSVALLAALESAR
ncbi:MAG: hypothetical protein AMXMBFR42_30160 [Burkholderiales bacterium]